jgi:hypothetical protein
MLGLDAAGKTTILYKLHIGEILSTVPTVGMFKKPVFSNVRSQERSTNVCLLVLRRVNAHTKAALFGIQLISHSIQSRDYSDAMLVTSRYSTLQYTVGHGFLSPEQRCDRTYTVSCMLGKASFRCLFASSVCAHHCPRTHANDYKGLCSQVSMSRKCSIRMSRSQCGMWVARRSCDLCGSTTSITLMV